MRTRPERVEPEIYFRIVHLAHDTKNEVRASIYREQTVEIALGPRVPFKTATQEFRTDEKAAGTNAPAAVVTLQPCAWRAALPSSPGTRPLKSIP